MAGGLGRTCVMVGMEVGQYVELAGLSSLVPVLAELVHGEPGARERPNEVRHGRRVLCVVLRTESSNFLKGTRNLHEKDLLPATAKPRAGTSNTYTGLPW